MAKISKQTQDERKNKDLIPTVNEYAPNEVGEVDLYQKREKIYTRAIEGFYQRIRLYTGWPLLLGFFLTPWIHWNGHQSIWFDLPNRKFYIFNAVFWPQDFMFLAWVLIIAAFGLFLFTTLFGRVWCGYSCPQTVWTSIFMWVEQKTEGSRNQRIKLDHAPWSFEKFARKFAKHALWAGFALLTGFTFIAYFTDVRSMVADFVTGTAQDEIYIWVGIFGFLTYLNAGWMREQVCMYMCPYARFQSALFDRDTLIVTYDEKRGEPRGARRVHDGEKNPELGDCVDCQLCVQVCPVGIDIRDGIQYECINCALCIDACNSVMEKIGYAPNLISYTTENALDGKPSKLLRPKTIGYGVAFLAMIIALTSAIALRNTIDVKVLRERSTLFQELDGQIINVYTLKVANLDTADHSYTVSTNLTAATIEGRTQFTVRSGDLLELPLRISIPDSSWSGRNQKIIFSVCDTTGSRCTREENSFVGPIR